MKFKFYQFLFIVSLNILSTHTNAQGLKQKLADRYYEQLAYGKALVYYKELADKKESSPENIRRAAECYKQINDLQSANIYYAKLIASEKATPRDALNYNLILKNTKNYTEVNTKLNEIKSSFPIISKRHSDFPNYGNVLLKDSGLYTIKALSINTVENDFSPLVRDNQFYFTSNRKKEFISDIKSSWDNSFFYNYYTAVYKDELFNAIKILCSDINFKYNDGPATISPDGNTMYVTTNYKTSNSKNKAQLKIFILKKDTVLNCWKKDKEFPYNNENYSVGHPALNEDGTILYFVSNMPGGFGQTDIYESRMENGNWTNPVNLGPNINTEGREMFPIVMNGGMLLFSSDGHAGLGGLDIYFAVPETDPYFAPNNFGYPINTVYDDFGVFLNDDLKSGFFSSNRPGGKGKDDIYSFKSSEAIKPEYFLEGIVKNKQTGEMIDSVSIVIKDNDARFYDSILNSHDGRYTNQMFAGRNYKVKALAKGYKTKTTEVYIDKEQMNTVLNIELEEKVTDGYKLVGQARDEKNQPLPGATVYIKDKVTSKEIVKVYSNENGYFSAFISGGYEQSKQLVYEFKIEKEGHQTKIVEYKHTLDTLNVLMINDKLDLSMLPKSDTILASNINLKNYTFSNVYYDLNKSELSENAKLTLDTIVVLLNQNKKLKIEITSHTDCRAGAGYNLLLSQKRTNEVLKYLVANKVNYTQVVKQSKGEGSPIIDCGCDESTNAAIVNTCTEDQHKKNRRTEFKLVFK